MSGIITAAVIAGGAAVASSSMAASGARKSASATAAAQADLRAQLGDAATAGSAEVGALADAMKKEGGGYVGTYEKQAAAALAGITYTPTLGAFDAGPDGKSQFQKLASLYATADEDRLKMVLGDSEPNIRKALKSFAALGAGDFSQFMPQLRSSEAAITAATRGSAIGTFANLSADNQFKFMKEGAAGTVSIAGLLESFSTPTTAVVQTALQASDEARREAERRDAASRTLASAKLGIAGSILSARTSLLSSFTSAKMSAANSLANALAGAAQQTYGGDGGAGNAQAIQAQLIASLGSTAMTGLSQYQAHQDSQARTAAIKDAGVSKAAASSGHYNDKAGNE